MKDPETHVRLTWVAPRQGVAEIALKMRRSDETPLQRVAWGAKLYIQNFSLFRTSDFGFRL